MPVHTYRIMTLGCRVNHAESRELESILCSRGFVPAREGGPVDISVVHSCSVTCSAAAKSRNALRRALRSRKPCEPGSPDSPRGTVFLTGCYADTNMDEARMILDEDGAVIPHSPGPRSGDSESTGSASMVERFAERIDHWLAGETVPAPRVETPRRTPPAPVRDRGDKRIIPLPLLETPCRPGKHTRAEIRIQDGCDACCTFCIIPRIRTRLRSKPIDTVVRETRELVALGHTEVVLSGIFIGAYGHETALRRKQERPGSSPLADLLAAVAEVDGLQRLRISSMEPMDVGPGLLAVMQEYDAVIVPHLHLPLQSGSDRILRRMNRQYGVDEYMRMIDSVNSALTRDGIPPAITTDIICGFPGETDEDFKRTVDTARAVGFLHMHVFPYSSRPGTAAARWTHQAVSPRIRKERVHHLIEMETDPESGMSITYRRKLVGKRSRVILERASRVKSSMMQGRIDQYALVTLKTDQERGTVLDIEITNVNGDDTHARVCAPAHELRIPA